MKNSCLATLCAIATHFAAMPVAIANFIDFSDEDVKVVFTQENVGGVIVTVATATIVEQDAGTGVITVRRQVERLTPDGSGGFEKVITEETTIATPDDPETPETYSVETTTRTITTLVDGSGNEGPPVEDESVDLDRVVPAINLDLPASTEFLPIVPELDDPIVISLP
jgi:hypothetical protein